MSDEFEKDTREDWSGIHQRDPVLNAAQGTAVYEQKQRKHQSYFGSVRFFKHLILAVLALLILIPSSLAVAFALRGSERERTIEEMKGSIEAQAKLLAVQQQRLWQQSAGSVSNVTLPEGEVPAWQTLYPDLYAAQAARSSVDAAQTVYLTFDDGPSAHTTEILEALARYDVKATFFVVGKTDVQSRQSMQAIVNAGHTIGIHSYSHDLSKIYGSVELFLDDFKQAYDLILETTGVAPQIFRFPGGSVSGYNTGVYQEIIAEMVRRGFVYFDWNMKAGDDVKGEGPSADTLASNALKDVGYYRRVILLMHDADSKANTVAALPEIIEGYSNAGYTLEPLTPEVKPVIFSYPD